MKISLGWISDFVDLSGTPPARLAELLSLHTAEVESLSEVGGEIADVVVGQVVTCGRHPDADKLSVTKVDFGAGELVDVVCGAANVREGLKIAFAPVGASLPGGVKIKQAKLRGAPSVGMICSERELALSEEQAGILELPNDAPLGKRLVDYLELRDWVLDLDNKSLTHRPDLWGHYGFAREVAAILGRPLRPLEAVFPWPMAHSPWSVELADSDCTHYLGVALEVPGGPRPSPQRIRARLTAVGVRPRNDIVDLTNWVLLETGQPMHAFDAARLTGRRIRVAPARAGESLRTLDEVERTLSTSDLVIADERGAVALAGVIGGAATAVGDATVQVLLETASFRPARVRRTAQRLALRTDASSRFEKSLDPLGVDLAARRFCALLAQIRPDARVSSAPVVGGSAAIAAREIPFDPQRCARLLGADPGETATREILERLGFQVAAGRSPWLVRVPSWRATKDVTLEVDLIEEVGRLHGYHLIQPAPLQAPVVPPLQQPQRLLVRNLSARLRGAHQAHETQAYSFITRAWAARLRQDPAVFVRLANPMQADADLVRRDPIASLLEQASANVREVGSGRLFEAARGYEPHSSGTPRERNWLGVVEWARRPSPDQGPSSLFARLRTVFEDLLRQVGVSDSCQAEPGGHADAPWLHPAHALTWRHGDRLLGWSGRLDPRLAVAMDGRKVAFAALLLDLAALQDTLTGAREVRFRSPPRLPAIKVDVALAVPAARSFREVASAIRAAGGKLLESLELFDLYEGPNLPAGQRSLAFHAVLRAADRTLEERDEQAFIVRIKEVAAALGGSLRA
jgi:phenylalanyl-tRNA synthetase beta chain